MLEGDPRSVRRPAWEVVARRVARQLFHAGAVGVDDVDRVRAAATACESDPRAIRRPRRIEIAPRTGQRLQAGAVGRVHDMDGAVALEHDPATVRRPRRLDVVERTARESLEAGAAGTDYVARSLDLWRSSAVGRQARAGRRPPGRR